MPIIPWSLFLQVSLPTKFNVHLDFCNVP
jgi:hypothetical protein